MVNMVSSTAQHTGATSTMGRIANLIPIVYEYLEEQINNNLDPGERKWSMSRFSEEANIQYPVIQRYVKGVDRVDLSILADFSNYLGLPYLLVNEDILPDRYERLPAKDVLAVLPGFLDSLNTKFELS